MFVGGALRIGRGVAKMLKCPPLSGVGLGTASRTSGYASSQDGATLGGGLRTKDFATAVPMRDDIGATGDSNS